MTSVNQSQIAEEYSQNSNNDELFYKKNENSEEFYVIPFSIAKTPKIKSKNFVCIFCQNVSTYPMICKDCDEIACGRCIKILEDKSDCICFDTGKFHQFVHPNQEIQQSFDNLIISCPSRDSNCKETIIYKNLKTHLNKCRYWNGTYSCLGCKKYDVLSEIECHVLICDQITWNCNYCNLPFKRQVLAQHLEICKFKLVQCFKCDLSIQQNQYEKHVSKDECLYKMMIDMKNTFNGMMSIVIKIF